MLPLSVQACVHMHLQETKTKANGRAQGEKSGAGNTSVVMVNTLTHLSPWLTHLHACPRLQLLLS